MDRSGSMNGDSIEAVRRALQLCLRSLEEGDAFDVVGFGSTFQTLFGAPRPYAQASLDEASAHVERLQADLGGTGDPARAALGAGAALRLRPPPRGGAAHRRRGLQRRRGGGARAPACGDDAGVRVRHRARGVGAPRPRGGPRQWWGRGDHPARPGAPRRRWCGSSAGCVVALEDVRVAWSGRRRSCRRLRPWRSCSTASRSPSTRGSTGRRVRRAWRR